MNDNKKYTIENLLFETKIENILDLLNLIRKSNYTLNDIIELKLIDCLNIKSIPKKLNNLKYLKVINCKNIKHIPKIPSLKKIEFVKPKINRIYHKKIIY